MKNDIVKQIKKIIGNTDADDDSIIFQLRRLLYEIDIRNVVIKESKPISTLVSGYLNDMKFKDPEKQIIKTGFWQLDQLTGGFHPGEFIVLGGRPSMGKTQLMVNFCLNISKTTPVLYFTFELSELLLSCRFMASLSGISTQKIMRKELSEEEKTTLEQIESKIGTRSIFVNESCNNSMSALKAQIEKQIKENNIRVIFLDYLQLISSNRYRSNRELEISYISRELKNIAKENNVCIIASSQLSRAVETRGGNKKPILSDLRESGAIEQDADKVIFLYRPEYYKILEDEAGNSTIGMAELILAKSRYSKLGSVLLSYDADFTNYTDFYNTSDIFSFSKDRLSECNDPF